MSHLRLVLLAVSVLASSATAQSEPREWKVSAGGNGHWYQAVNWGSPVAWEDARKAALHSGGDLVCIGNISEAKFVNEIALDSRLWHNHSGAPHGPWIGALRAATPSGWAWSNGEAWDYSAWASGQPNNAGSNQDRAHYWTRSKNLQPTWQDIAGRNAQVYSFIVEYTEKPDWLNVQQRTSEPQFSVVDHPSGRRFTFTPQPMAWDEAESWARSVGGHLAIVDSPELQDWLLKSMEFPSLSPEWRGQCVWLGIRYNRATGRWTTVLGDVAPYLNWDARQPNKGVGEDYVGMNTVEHSAFGKWHDWLDFAPGVHPPTRFYGLVEFPPPEQLPSSVVGAPSAGSASSPLLPTEQPEMEWIAGTIIPALSPEFQPMTDSDNGRWWTRRGVYRTSIADNNMIPNGKGAGAGLLPDEQWAVRRWTSPKEGRALLLLHAAHATTNGYGNGLVARVRVDGESLWSRHIESFNHLGYGAIFPVDLESGSTVDLIVEPCDADATNDEAVFTCSVLWQSPVAQSQVTPEVRTFGPKYLEVPLVGRFGEDIQSRGVRNAIEWAIANEVDDVLLRIDSEGGELHEAVEVLALIQEHAPNIRFHAVVQRAANVALLVIVPCDSIWIFSQPNGGVVIGSDGVDEESIADFDPDVMAAFTIAAQMRGRDPLPLYAMINRTTTLFAIVEDEKIKLEALAPNPTSGSKSVLLDGARSLFGTSAHLADAVGIGTMISSPDATAVGAMLGADQWESAGDEGANLMAIAARHFKIEASALKKRTARAEQYRASREHELRQELDTEMARFRSDVIYAEMADPRTKEWFKKHKLPITILDMRKWQTTSDECIAAWTRVSASLARLKRLNRFWDSYDLGPRPYDVNEQEWNLRIERELRYLYRYRLQFQSPDGLIDR